MMTITSATTKSELVEVLKKSTSKVRKVSTELADRVKYATGMFAKDASKVTKKDLVSLLAEVDKALAVPANADTKKAPAKATTSKEKPKATLKKKEEPKVENLVKKPSVKKSAEKPEVKKPAPKKADKKTSIQEELDAHRVSFPESIKIDMEDGEAEYTLAKGKFKNFKELEKYVSDEDNPTIVIAMPMTKQQAKEINYGLNAIPLPKDGFPNDLDIMIPIYVGQNNPVLAIASLYTDNVMLLLNTGNIDDVEEIDGVRYMGAYAYQIYVEA